MSITIEKVDRQALSRLIRRGEGHFLDFKSKDIKPSKLTKTLSAFANADGGELYIGFDERTAGRFVWNGFETVEDANGHIQAIEISFPLSSYFRYTFLSSETSKTLILQIDIAKTADIRKAADGIAYLRRGAQSLPQTEADQIRRLGIFKRYKQL
ncbi:helix-turn-helix domain-containing protein [Methylorubrum aminovorans]|uniref:AlbA family DNA-binding domain-containing protein n=1 Tax=Methylorubrum aminovorans TaxID=269069 RepID=UPI003C3034DD